MRGAYEVGWVLAFTAERLSLPGDHNKYIQFIRSSSFLKGRISFTAVLQISSVLSSESHLQQDDMKTDVAGPCCGIAGCHGSAVTTELGKA